MFGKPKKKRSFFEKLTGAVPVDELDDFEFEEEQEQVRQPQRRHVRQQMQVEEDLEEYEEENEPESLMEEEVDGQLSVDVINTEDSIIIKSMLAGVKPSDMDIDISRDMVTIRGEREEAHSVKQDDYYHKELYWGSFSRNILLPEEIDVDAAEALEKHGLLTLKLPKLDKTRKTKLHVKSK